jgi:HEAT repeats
MLARDISGRELAKSPMRLPVRTLMAVIAGLIVFGFSSTSALGYSPKDPVVEAMVDRGIKYLEGVPAIGGREGTKMMVAYAHHKCRHDPENPLVKQGIAEAKKFVQLVATGGLDLEQKRNYLIAVCVLLLAEVDADLYKPDLELLQQSLMGGQYTNGAFGYPGEKDGDVSQTQYALLAIWTLDRNGIKMDYNRVVSAILWLLRVQDVNGGWPYHGQDPGPGKPNVPQNKVDMSMSLAGGSSVLIAGDALRLWGDTVDDADPGIPDLPVAIKLYKEDTNAKVRKSAAITQEPVKAAVQRMNGWRQQNPYKRGAIDWYYYQIYTLERYESFIEIANGSPKDDSPVWYNTVVEELKQTQGGDGGWTERSQTTSELSTAFALLFLIRSTQKAIFQDHSGALRGGYGLPKDTTNIQVDGTQIKGPNIAEGVNDLLKLLEADGADDMEGKSIPDDLELPTDPVERKAQLDRLERLVRGSKSWQARRVAAKLLGKSDELRVVPALIYALSDNDESVRRYARDGLGFISRKFDGFDLPDKPTREEVEQAQAFWRDWYRRMNPKYVFLDYDL